MKSSREESTYRLDSGGLLTSRHQQVNKERVRSSDQLRLRLLLLVTSRRTILWDFLQTEEGSEKETECKICTTGRPTATKRWIEVDDDLRR